MVKKSVESSLTADNECAICQTGSTVEKFVAPGMKSQLSTKLCLECKEKVNQHFLAETQDSNIVRAITWGVLAAAVGSAVWYFVAIWTGLEIGYLAIGLGLWIGLAVHFGSGKKKGRRLQIISLILTFLAIIIAKKLIFDYYLNDYLQGHLADFQDFVVGQKVSVSFFAVEFWQSVASIKGLLISLLGLVVAFVICAPRKLK